MDRSHPLFDLNEAQPHHHDDGSQPLILSLSKPEPNTSYLSDLSLSKT